MSEIKTICHPEANGRKAKAGEVCYSFTFVAEDGESVVIHMGAEGWAHHSQHVLDMLTEAPSYGP